jgi:hypothetical protein
MKKRCLRKTRKGGGKGNSSLRPNNSSQKKSGFRASLRNFFTRRKKNNTQITPLEILQEESEEDRVRREAEEEAIRKENMLQHQLMRETRIEKKREMSECIKTWCIENLKAKTDEEYDDYLSLMLKHMLNTLNKKDLDIACGSQTLTLKVYRSWQYYNLQGSYTPEDENTFVDLYED